MLMRTKTNCQYISGGLILIFILLNVILMKINVEAKSLPQSVTEGSRQRNAKLQDQRFKAYDRILYENEAELQTLPKPLTRSPIIPHKVPATAAAPTTGKSTSTTTYMNDIEYDLRLRQLMEDLVLYSRKENQQHAVHTLLPMDLKDDYRQRIQTAAAAAAEKKATKTPSTKYSTTTVRPKFTISNNKITTNNIKANYQQQQDNKDFVSSSSYSSTSPQILYNDRRNNSTATKASTSAATLSSLSSTSLKDSLLDYVLLEYMTKTKQNLTKILDANKFSNSSNSTSSLANAQRLRQQLEFLQKNAEKFKKFQQVEQRTKNATTSESAVAAATAATAWDVLQEIDAIQRQALQTQLKEATQMNDHDEHLNLEDIKLDEIPKEENAKQQFIAINLNAKQKETVDNVGNMEGKNVTFNITQESLALSLAKEELFAETINLDNIGHFKDKLNNADEDENKKDLVNLLSVSGTKVNSEETLNKGFETLGSQLENKLTSNMKLFTNNSSLQKDNISPTNLESEQVALKQPASNSSKMEGTSKSNSSTAIADKLILQESDQFKSTNQTPFESDQFKPINQTAFDSESAKIIPFEPLSATHIESSDLDTHVIEALITNLKLISKQEELEYATNTSEKQKMENVADQNNKNVVETLKTEITNNSTNVVENEEVEISTILPTISLNLNLGNETSTDTPNQLKAINGLETTTVLELENIAAHNTKNVAEMLTTEITNNSTNIVENEEVEISEILPTISLNLNLGNETSTDTRNQLKAINGLETLELENVTAHNNKNVAEMLTETTNNLTNIVEKEEVEISEIRPTIFLNVNLGNEISTDIPNELKANLETTSNSRGDYENYGTATNLEITTSEEPLTELMTTEVSTISDQQFKETNLEREENLSDLKKTKNTTPSLLSHDEKNNNSSNLEMFEDPEMLTIEIPAKSTTNVEEEQARITMSLLNSTEITTSLNLNLGNESSTNISKELKDISATQQNIANRQMENTVLSNRKIIEHLAESKSSASDIVSLDDLPESTTNFLIENGSTNETPSSNYDGMFEDLTTTSSQLDRNTEDNFLSIAQVQATPTYSKDYDLDSIKITDISTTPSAIIHSTLSNRKQMETTTEFSSTADDSTTIVQAESTQFYGTDYDNIDDTTVNLKERQETTTQSNFIEDDLISTDQMESTPYYGNDWENLEATTISPKLYGMKEAFTLSTTVNPTLTSYEGQEATTEINPITRNSLSKFQEDKLMKLKINSNEFQLKTTENPEDFNIIMETTTTELPNIEITEFPNETTTELPDETTTNIIPILNSVQNRSQPMPNVELPTRNIHQFPYFEELSNPELPIEKFTAEPKTLPNEIEALEDYKTSQNSTGETLGAELLKTISTKNITHKQHSEMLSKTELPTEAETYSNEATTEVSTTELSTIKPSVDGLVQSTMKYLETAQLITEEIFSTKLPNTTMSPQNNDNTYVTESPTRLPSNIKANELVRPNAEEDFGKAPNTFTTVSPYTMFSNPTVGYVQSTTEISTTEMPTIEQSSKTQKDLEEIDLTQYVTEETFTTTLPSTTFYPKIVDNSVTESTTQIPTNKNSYELTTELPTIKPSSEAQITSEEFTTAQYDTTLSTPNIDYTENTTEVLAMEPPKMKPFPEPQRTLEDFETVLHVTEETLSPELPYTTLSTVNDNLIDNTTELPTTELPTKILPIASTNFESADKPLTAVFSSQILSNQNVNNIYSATEEPTITLQNNTTSSEFANDFESNNKPTENSFATELPNTIVPNDSIDYTELPTTELPTKDLEPSSTALPNKSSFDIEYSSTAAPLTEAETLKIPQTSSEQFEFDQFTTDDITSTESTTPTYITVLPTAETPIETKTLNASYENQEIDNNLTRATPDANFSTQNITKFNFSSQNSHNIHTVTELSLTESNSNGLSAESQILEVEGNDFQTESSFTTELPFTISPTVGIEYAESSIELPTTKLATQIIPVETIFKPENSSSFVSVDEFANIASLSIDDIHYETTELPPYAISNDLTFETAEPISEEVDNDRDTTELPTEKVDYVQYNSTELPNDLMKNERTQSGEENNTVNTISNIDLTTETTTDTAFTLIPVSVLPPDANELQEETVLRNNSELPTKNINIVQHFAGIRTTESPLVQRLAVQYPTELPTKYESTQLPTAYLLNKQDMLLQNFVANKKVDEKKFVNDVATSVNEIPDIVSPSLTELLAVSQIKLVDADKGIKSDFMPEIFTNVDQTKDENVEQSIKQIQEINTLTTFNVSGNEFTSETLTTNTTAIVEKPVALDPHNNLATLEPFSLNKVPEILPLSLTQLLSGSQIEKADDDKETKSKLLPDQIFSTIVSQSKAENNLDTFEPSTEFETLSATTLNVSQIEPLSEMLITNQSVASAVALDPNNDVAALKKLLSTSKEVNILNMDERVYEFDTQTPTPLRVAENESLIEILTTTTKSTTDPDNALDSVNDMAALKEFYKHLFSESGYFSNNDDKDQSESLLAEAIEQSLVKNGSFNHTKAVKFSTNSTVPQFDATNNETMQVDLKTAENNVEYPEKLQEVNAEINDTALNESENLMEVILGSSEIKSSTATSNVAHENQLDVGSSLSPDFQHSDTISDESQSETLYTDLISEEAQHEDVDFDINSDINFENILLQILSPLIDAIPESKTEMSYNDQENKDQETIPESKPEINYSDEIKKEKVSKVVHKIHETPSMINYKKESLKATRAEDMLPQLIAEIPHASLSFANHNGGLKHKNLTRQTDFGSKKYDYKDHQDHKSVSMGQQISDVVTINGDNIEQVSELMEALMNSSFTQKETQVNTNNDPFKAPDHNKHLNYDEPPTKITWLTQSTSVHIPAMAMSNKDYQQHLTKPISSTMTQQLTNAAKLEIVKPQDSHHESLDELITIIGNSLQTTAADAAAATNSKSQLEQKETTENLKTNNDKGKKCEEQATLHEDGLAMFNCATTTTQTKQLTRRPSTTSIADKAAVTTMITQIAPLQIVATTTESKESEQLAKAATIEKWSTFKNNHLNNDSLSQADNDVQLKSINKKNANDVAASMTLLHADNDGNAKAGHANVVDNVRNVHDVDVAGTGDEDEHEVSINDKDIRLELKVKQKMIHVANVNNSKRKEEEEAKDDSNHPNNGAYTNNEFKISTMMTTISDDDDADDDNKDNVAVNAEAGQHEMSTIETKLHNISQNNPNDMSIKLVVELKASDFFQQQDEMVNMKEDMTIPIPKVYTNKGNEAATATKQKDIVKNRFKINVADSIKIDDKPKDEEDFELEAEALEQLSTLTDTFLDTQSFPDMTPYHSNAQHKSDTKEKHQQQQQHILPTSVDQYGKEEITATNWWYSLPYTEIRKFLNSIFDSFATSNDDDEFRTLQRNVTKALKSDVAISGSNTTSASTRNASKSKRKRKSKRQRSSPALPKDHEDKATLKSMWYGFWSSMLV